MLQKVTVVIVLFKETLIGHYDYICFNYANKIKVIQDSTKEKKSSKLA